MRSSKLGEIKSISYLKQKLKPAISWGQETAASLLSPGCVHWMTDSLDADWCKGLIITVES